MVSQLLTIIIAMALVGFALWLVLNYIPMPEPIKKAIVVIVVLVLLLVIARMLLAGGSLAQLLR